MHTTNSLARLLLTLALSLLACAASAGARHVDEVRYAYPYLDPYLATTTIAIMKGRDERENIENIRDLQVSLIEGRNDIPYLEGKGKLRYRLYDQKEEAPLVMVIPGLGSSAYAGSASYLAEMLYAEGFHVLVLPDPLNWNFALAVSSTGFPGDHFADAGDMYRAMQTALRQVTRELDVEVGRVGLLGFSEGALNAAFVDKLDSEQGKINFATTLLVNPPADPLFAIRKIDEMAQAGLSLSAKERTQVQAYAFGTGVRALRENFEDPHYFDDWDKRLRMTNTQIRYLIGAALFSEVGDTMYTIELAMHPHVLKAPFSKDLRTPRLEEARSIGVLGYLNRFLLPRLKQKDPQMDMETLDATTSLRAIGTALAKSKRVFLMHNRDDILLQPQDMDFFERTFGNRAIIYPRGGHLGNLWYPPNKADMVAHFKHYLVGDRTLEDLF